MKNNFLKIQVCRDLLKICKNQLIWLEINKKLFELIFQKFYQELTKTRQFDRELLPIQFFLS